jgi:Carboxypeptidase regulatory-like domain
LSGTIRDNTSAVIPNAGVILKNTATGIVRELKTNSSGEYVAAAVLPGQYNLSVSVAGFRKYQADGVILRMAQNARIDVTMRVGNLKEEVTVHGEGTGAILLSSLRSCPVSATKLDRMKASSVTGAGKQHARE